MTSLMEFYIPGQPFDGGTYHYVECGLDNIVLLNGFSIEEDADYGRLVSFQEPEMLHRAIAMRIIEQGRPLEPKEFKFIRRLSGLTQTYIAQTLGVDAQTVANYEKGKTSIPKSADTVFKAGYLLSIMPEDVRASVIQEIINRKNKKLSKFAERDRSRAITAWRDCTVHILCPTAKSGVLAIG